MSKLPSVGLNINHCKEVLNREIMIGRENARDGKCKQFGFNTWKNEYYVTHNWVVIDSGQAVEELLKVYNDL